jgi:hypothetical protein
MPMSIPCIKSSIPEVKARPSKGKESGYRESSFKKKKKKRKEKKRKSTNFELTPPKQNGYFHADQMIPRVDVPVNNPTFLRD